MSSTKRKREPTQADDGGLAELELLSSVEYDRTHIDTLLEAYTVQTSAKDASVDSGKPPILHCCPRAYEDDFLREAVGNERPCGRDKSCEGLKLHGTTGFVLREFTYPGTPHEEHRAMCLICRRLEISKAFFKSETGDTDTYPVMHLSDHYNLVDVPGEYDIRDCIVSGKKYTGLQLPVVLHVRSAYSCHTKDGVKHLSQSRMRCPGTGDTLEQGPFLGRRAALALGKQAARSEKCHPEV